MANHPDAFQSSRRSQCSSASVLTTWLYHSDAIQCLTSIRVSASGHSYGKTAATVRTMSSTRQDVHQFNRPDISLQGPDAPSFIMIITCSRDAVNRDSTIQSDVRRFCLQVRRNPSSLSAIRTIEPSHLDAPLSTVPSVRTMCHSIQTLDRSSSFVQMTCSFRPDPYTVSRRFCSSLHLSGRFNRTSGRL